ncbi:hypothetical protein NIES2101_16060 [Calothrix sp. HK-06]|nr:hypothetical protein NIES2101_16060 [Calothrix sp. HK-06]
MFHTHYYLERGSQYLDILKQMFLWASKTKGLAFRLHQFISQGGSVYATIENRDKRLFTLECQYKTTEDRKSLYNQIRFLTFFYKHYDCKK